MFYSVAHSGERWRLSRAALNCYQWSPGQHGKLSLKVVPTGFSSFLVGSDTLEGDI